MELNKWLFSYDLKRHQKWMETKNDSNEEGALYSSCGALENWIPQIQELTS
jgi:hypothetical protein